MNFVIKVADFGLAESIDSSKDYFRQDQENTVKLPIKWLAPESINDGLFSEKTDVVSLNEHAPYKRGVAWSFHGDNFSEKSGGVSPFVALLPLNSHCSGVLWMQESFVVTLSCLTVGSSGLVSF